MSEKWKENLIGTPLGRVALSFRDTVNLLRAAYSCSEQVGTIANDQLAMLLVTSMCRANKIFIDVGAHIGSIISEVMRRDSSIKIIAIEAMPEKAANLRRKMPYVEIHSCAAGETSGEASFFVNLEKSAFSALEKSGSSKDGSTVEIKVPIRRLDQLVTSTEVDVIKIDVVGAELGVLRGGASLLSSSRPIVVLDSGPQEKFGYTKESLWQFLESIGYVVLIPNRVAHNGPGLTQDGFVESHVYPARTQNYFAIPRERRTEVRDRARDILNIRRSTR